MKEYQIGDGDQRPWGRYTVTGAGTEAGEEFCEKSITVLPGKVLSLQSHNLRRERWTVMTGTLTALVGEKRVTLEQGDSVEIGRTVIHCMANLGNAECVVHEIQRGGCREEDIIRYADAYGRATDAAGPEYEKILALYDDILREIEKSFSNDAKQQLSG